MKICIIRNTQTYGPFDIMDVKRYVESGKLLHCDKAYLEQWPEDVHTVGYYFKKVHLRVKVPHKGHLFSQIKEIGDELIIPRDIFQRRTWLEDKRLLLLALLGLTPLALMIFLGGDFLTFYTISLYFATIWGLFFYYFFKTKQVRLKTTFAVFFLTQATVFLIFGLGLNELNFFYLLPPESNFITRLLFFVFAVGVTEELTKMIPLLIICRRAKEPLIPQTLVFYGLMSGIAFGVFEGVEYQMGDNALLEYSESFFANIARLTSLPFLHAIWCAIAGYFVAFAKLYPRYRRSLYFLALSIPALLHGIYDTCQGSLLTLLVALPLTFLGIVLLMSYLKRDTKMQSKLRGEE